MTAETTPFAIQTGGETAEHFRRLFDALVGANAVIFASGDLAVTAQATPNMSVLVAGGRVAVKGTQATYQGTYFGENRGNTTLTITASDPTNPRRDLIVASVRDAQYSGTDNNFDVRVVAGTPAASPVDPATPANAFVLARVAVAAGATSVTNANITDLRTTTTGQSLAPAGVPSGQWTGYTPTVTQGVTVSKSVTYARYMKVGRKVTVQVYLAITSSGTAGSAINVSLPFNAAQVSLPGGAWYWAKASNGVNYNGIGIVTAAGTMGGIINGTGLILGQYTPNQLLSGDLLLMSLTYEATT